MGQPLPTLGRKAGGYDFWETETSGRADKYERDTSLNEESD